VFIADTTTLNNLLEKVEITNEALLSSVMCAVASGNETSVRGTGVVGSRVNWSGDRRHCLHIDDVLHGKSCSRQLLFRFRRHFHLRRLRHLGIDIRTFYCVTYSHLTRPTSKFPVKCNYNQLSVSTCTRLLEHTLAAQTNSTNKNDKIIKEIVESICLVL